MTASGRRGGGEKKKNSRSTACLQDKKRKERKGGESIFLPSSKRGEGFIAILILEKGKKRKKRATPSALWRAQGRRGISVTFIFKSENSESRDFVSLGGRKGEEKRKKKGAFPESDLHLAKGKKRKRGKGKKKRRCDHMASRPYGVREGSTRSLGRGRKKRRRRNEFFNTQDRRSP